MQLGKRDILGLDIGSYSVKLIQMRKSSKGWSVQAGAIAEISDKVSANLNTHETNTIRAISDCIRIARVKSTYSVCSLEITTG